MKTTDDNKETFGSKQRFQDGVDDWVLLCFGAEVARDTIERNHRFLEESLELVQACGCTSSEAHQLVDYVYGRPAGERTQEVGGVMVTLAALCNAQKLDMETAGNTELARVWTKVEKIRAKQAAKPKHSPLPVAVSPETCGVNQSATELLNQFERPIAESVGRKVYRGILEDVQRIEAALTREYVVYAGDRIYCRGCRTEVSGTPDDMKLMHKDECALYGRVTMHTSRTTAG